jgi:hypothetical protein
MYNTNLILTYKDISNIDISDKTYRKEFLQVLNLDDYDNEKVAVAINKIYKDQKEIFRVVLEYISKNNKFPITIPPEECFPFLFAWEFFDITYDCIKTTDMFKKNYYLAKLWDKVKKSK